jgi:hypothetical protein
VAAAVAQRISAASQFGGTVKTERLPACYGLRARCTEVPTSLGTQQHDVH